MSSSFNILQTPNTNESVTLNYLPMGLSGVMLDPTNKWVTGMCSRSTSPNVVYTDSQNDKSQLKIIVLLNNPSLNQLVKLNA